VLLLLLQQQLLLLLLTTTPTINTPTTTTTTTTTTTNAGAVVDITGVEAVDTARRELLVGDAMIVDYNIKIIMELYGVDENDVFDVVNGILVAATGTSTVLQDAFNMQLVSRLGSATLAVGVDDLETFEDELVFSVLNTPVPTSQPSAPPKSSSSSNNDDTTLIIIIVVVVGTVLIVCSAGIYWVLSRLGPAVPSSGNAEGERAVVSRDAEMEMVKTL
jgi:hypothetical protein